MADESISYRELAFKIGYNGDGGGSISTIKEMDKAHIMLVLSVITGVNLVSGFQYCYSLMKFKTLL